MSLYLSKIYVVALSTERRPVWPPRNRARLYVVKEGGKLMASHRYYNRGTPKLEKAKRREQRAEWPGQPAV